jgi:hypothetical protein
MLVLSHQVTIDCVGAVLFSFLFISSAASEVACVLSTLVGLSIECLIEFII